MIGSLLLLVSATAVAPVQAGDAAIHFEIRDDRLYVPVTVAGRPMEALLDSGAEMTVIDSTAAAELGLAAGGSEVMHGSGGESEAQFAENVALSIGGRKLPPTTAAVLDLGDVAERLHLPVRVILGRNFFDAGRWAIDFATRTIRSVAPNVEPEGQGLPLTDEHGIELMPVMIEGQGPVQAAFDLGNGSGVMVGATYAHKAGLDAPDRIVGSKAGGGLGGQVERSRIVLRSVTIAGRTFNDVPAAIDPTSHADDANIGTALLKQFRITVDYPGHMLWLAPVEKAGD